MSSSLLFNPSQASTEELESTFVGRHELLDRLERDLLEDQNTGTPRHWHLIGPRGSGKSHLTELLARRLRIQHGWRVARLPEENYQISTLGELLEQIVIRSEGALAPPLQVDRDDLQLQDRAIDRLRQQQAILCKPLLVILENLSSLFDRQLRATKEQARLRDILTNQPPFILVATSTSQRDATTKHSAPFYDFFHTIVLQDLTSKDITELVRARADWEQNTALLANFGRMKERLKAIYHLSGGNPRLALALYRVVQDGVTTELYDQVMKLLDEVTPYYQARLNDIPPQAARVLTEMAVSDTIATPAGIARRCRIPTNQVTAQITKLLDERLIIQGGRPNARSRFYEFRDRLLRIWIQMRESVGSTRRLRFLTTFFERWYAGYSDELEMVSKRTISDLWGDLAIGDERRCVDKLKTLSYLSEIKPGFDGSVVLKVMAAHVNAATESDVKAHLEALERTFEKSIDLREREAAAFLLGACHMVLDTEQESVPYLQRVINEGSQSEAIALKYMAGLVAANKFQEAWEFGSNWRNQHPQDLLIYGSLGISALGSRHIEQGYDLLQKYIGMSACMHCKERVLRKSASILHSYKWEQDLKYKFWRQLLNNNRNNDISDAQLNAVLEVLICEQISKLPGDIFICAAEAWGSLSEAPLWFLSKSICALGHRTSYAHRTLSFISAISQRSSNTLSQFVVDHLIEVTLYLSYEHHRQEHEEITHAYYEAVSLIRKRVAKDRLTKSFKIMAPFIAKRHPKYIRDMIGIYGQWLKEGLIEENITPYSEALAILNSEHPEAVIHSLHPEIRDAALLLIKHLKRLEGTNPEG